MLGTIVLYNYPGQKTAKGREVLAVLPAIVMAVHEKEGTLDLMVVRERGEMEPRSHVRPLAKRDADQDKTEADFYFTPLSPAETAAQAKERKKAEIAKRKAELAELEKSEK